MARENGFRRKKRSSGVVERVPGAAHGTDEVGHAGEIDRLAQAADVDVDGACLDIDVMTPYLVEQLLARKDAAGMLHEEAQQAELRRPEMDRSALTGYAMGYEIHGKIGEAQHLLGARRLGAAHHGAQSRDQLGWAERLDDVVVGAAVETAHAVALFAARRQHDDGYRARGGSATDLPAHLDAGDERQHPVKQDDVGL